MSRNMNSVQDKLVQPDEPKHVVHPGLRDTVQVQQEL